MVIRLFDSKRREIVYVPGFGSGPTPLAVRSLMDRLRADGHRVHYVPLSRSAAPDAASPYPAPLWQMAQAVQAYIKENDLREVHLIGHSMGAVVALIVAKERPDCIKQVAAVAPACTYPIGLVRLALSTTWKGILDQWYAWRPDHPYREVARLLIKDARRYIGWRPRELRRVLCEARSLLKPLALQLAADLAQAGQVGVWVVYGDRDVLFKPRRTQAAVSQLDSVRVVCIPEGKHDIPQFQPHFLYYHLTASKFLP